MLSISLLLYICSGIRNSVPLFMIFPYLVFSAYDAILITSVLNFLCLWFSSLQHSNLLSLRGTLNLIILQCCQCQDYSVDDGMWNENWQGKLEYLEKTCSSAILSTNPTYPDLRLNPGHCGGKPATTYCLATAISNIHNWFT